MVHSPVVLPVTTTGPRGACVAALTSRFETTVHACSGSIVDAGPLVDVDVEGRGAVGEAGQPVEHEVEQRHPLGLGPEEPGVHPGGVEHPADGVVDEVDLPVDAAQQLQPADGRQLLPGVGQRLRGLHEHRQGVAQLVGGHRQRVVALLHRLEQATGGLDPPGHVAYGDDPAGPGRRADLGQLHLGRPHRTVTTSQLDLERSVGVAEREAELAPDQRLGVAAEHLARHLVGVADDAGLVDHDHPVRGPVDETHGLGRVERARRGPPGRRGTVGRTGLAGWTGSITDPAARTCRRCRRARTRACGAGCRPGCR